MVWAGMKVAVYLDSTLELLGVVECDQECYELLRQRRHYCTAKYTMPKIDFMAAMSEIPTNTYERIDFEAVTLQRSNGAVAIALLVKKREHLAAWDGRQVWPRKRDKRHKRTKSERKYMQGIRGPLVGTRGHVSMIDDPHGNGTPRS